jgi:hypothetical protein
VPSARAKATRKHKRNTAQFRKFLRLVAAAKIMRPGRGATPDISQRRKSLENDQNENAS